MRNINQLRLASALAEISIQTTRRCKEDYLYELVSIASMLNQGIPYILTTRSSGADGITRFGDFLTDNLAEGIEAAKKSLGVDCVFIFRYNEDWHFDIEIVNVGLDKSTMWLLTSGLDSRGIKYVVSGDNK